MRTTIALSSPLRRHVGCVRLREAAEVGLLCGARRSGDSVVDEAALKWSDLAHESSGGRVDERCARVEPRGCLLESY